MPAVTLRAAPFSTTLYPTQRNPLPPLLQTPSGLAIIEIQGTIHASFPTPALEEDNSVASCQPATPTPIGRLEFPLYNPADADDTKWMKKVYFYVGKHQRLTGEVKKLGKPLAVIRKRDDHRRSEDAMDVDGSAVEELEIVEIVRWKLLFGARPEPVGERASEPLG